MRDTFLFCILLLIAVPSSVLAQAIDCNLYPLECANNGTANPDVPDVKPQLKFEFKFDLPEKKPRVKPRRSTVVVKPKVKPRPPTLQPEPKKISGPKKRDAKPTRPEPTLQPKPRETVKQIELPQPKRTTSKNAIVVKVPKPSWDGLKEMPLIRLESEDQRDIEGQYIVGFDAATLAAAGIDLATITIQDLAQRLGLRPEQIQSVQRRFLLSAVILANAQEAGPLAQNPLVARFVADTRIKAAGGKLPLSWGLDRLDSPTLPMDGVFERKGGDYSARVYLFDTLVDAWAAEFGKRVTNAQNFYRQSAIEKASSAKCKEHGTEMASLIAGKTTGAAPTAEIVALGVLPCQREGTGAASALIEAVEWVLIREADFGDGKPALANMSLAGKRNTEINRAVKILTDNKIIVVTAAGNQGRDACQFSPASAAEAITVAATGPQDETPGFSNFGKCIDVQAPGRLLTAITEDDKMRYVTVTGTSGATALVSGILARAFTQEGPAAAQSWLVENAIPTAFRRANSKSHPMVQSRQKWGVACVVNANVGDIVLREKPSQNAVAMQSIAPNTPMLLVGKQKNWLRVIAPGGTVGWFPDEFEGVVSLVKTPDGSRCQL